MAQITQDPFPFHIEVTVCSLKTIVVQHSRLLLMCCCSVRDLKELPGAPENVQGRQGYSDCPSSADMPLISEGHRI